MINNIQNLFYKVPVIIASVGVIGFLGCIQTLFLWL